MFHLLTISFVESGFSLTLADEAMLWELTGGEAAAADVAVAVAAAAAAVAVVVAVAVADDNVVLGTIGDAGLFM